MNYSDRKNILFVFVDQMKYEIMGVNGSEVCRTPNLDKLALTGTRFNRAYTPCPLCSPARSSVLTGQYPHNHGVLTNIGDRQSSTGLKADQWTFAKALKESGYRTGYIGKWHVNNEGPSTAGFDEDYLPSPSKGFMKTRREERGLVPESTKVADQITHQMPHDEILLGGTDPYPIEGTENFIMTDVAIEFLEESAGSDEPFCLRLDFQGPHFPFIAPEPFDSMYDPAVVPIDPTFEGRVGKVPFVHEEQLRIWNTKEMEWADWQPIIAKYWGLMTFIDDQIGRALDALDRLGLTEDTVVVFGSDHGDTTGSYNMFDKGYRMYECTQRIPMVIRYPGLNDAGFVCDAFVNLVDLAPTLCEVGSVSACDDVDGRSLIPLLKGETPRDWPDDAFSEFHGMHWGLYSQRMVRTERYKLVWNAGDVSELYDFEKDPYELSNRIDDPGYQDIKDDLWDRMLARMEESRDPFGNFAWWRRAYDAGFEGEKLKTQYCGTEMQV